VGGARTHRVMNIGVLGSYEGSTLQACGLISERLADFRLALRLWSATTALLALRSEPDGLVFWRSISSRTPIPTRVQLPSRRQSHATWSSTSENHNPLRLNRRAPKTAIRRFGRRPGSPKR
jgi:hypothetical protein